MEVIPPKQKLPRGEPFLQVRLKTLEGFRLGIEEAVRLGICLPLVKTAYE